ncbi:MAG: GNAT family N-acetyltransferase [Kiloniellaceae bacterium]
MTETDSPETDSPQTDSGATIAMDRLTGFHGPDLHDLCDAAEAAILQGGGFGWLNPPPRQTMEAYWQGVLLVPERELFVGRLDGTIAGSAQLLRAPRNNEAQSLTGQLTTFFVAPWARGHGLAPALVAQVEDAARANGLRVLNLDVRDTQTRAIEVVEEAGFVRWGTHPHYAWVNDRWATGLFYYKDLHGNGGLAEGEPAVGEAGSGGAR